ncbi:hypothetical protein AX769_14610 [Frondihabitans sp. PAMC 28766]|nr:hypothetical protein AX769_14610 [Frondihabitans sp. PAMC 28766]
MFCGQCGRAITSADVAAFRAEQDAENEAAAATSATEIPAWSLQEPPAAQVPSGTPWWVAEREGGGGDGRDGKAAEAIPDAPRPSPLDEDDDGAPVSAPSAAALPEADDALSTDVGDEPVGADSPPQAVRHEDDAISAPHDDPLPPVEPAIEEPPVDPGRDGPPAPLRPPGSVSSGGGRPTSAPLWTASLTPVTETPAEGAEADAPDSHPAASEPDAGLADGGSSEASQPGAPLELAAPAERESTPDSQPASSLRAPEQHSEPDPASASSLRAPEQHSEPEPGDTNVIAPLVAPTAAREDGRLRCTVCGADLSADDIFCGECGTVVQSVAQSFTGPITPILTGPVTVPTTSEPREPAPDDAPTRSLADRPQDASPDTSPAEPPHAPRPAPLAPTPVAPAEQSPPPFVPDPEPAPKKRRLFGRRPQQEAPKLWSESAPPTPSAGPVPPMPSSDDASPAVADESIRDPEAGVAARPLGVDDVPVVPEAERAADPALAPLHATPLDAPPQTAEPVVAPLPPAPETPRSAAPWAVGSLTDDVEKTRIVARKPLGDAYVLQFSTGESFTVQGSGLVGRAPTPQPGESIDLLVRIVDPGKSVSKTHLEFGQDDGSLWVADRWSGNGTVVRLPSEAAKRAEPGKRVRVPRGARVEIGEQFFIVS